MGRALVLGPRSGLRAREIWSLEVGGVVGSSQGGCEVCRLGVRAGGDVHVACWPGVTSWGW